MGLVNVITPSENENCFNDYSCYWNLRSSGPSSPFLCEARPRKERIIAWSQVNEIAEDHDFAKGLSLRSKVSVGEYAAD